MHQLEPLLKKINKKNMAEYLAWNVPFLIDFLLYVIRWSMGGMAGLMQAEPDYQIDEYEFQSCRISYMHLHCNTLHSYLLIK